MLEELWYPKARESRLRRALLSPLWLASLGFRAGVTLRSLYYDQPSHVVRVPGIRVVSVGNLNVGGAGKTPAVLELVRRARAHGMRVAVLSRGYGRRSPEDLGDEPIMVSRRFPDVPVLVGADRVDLARRAQKLGANVAILDDGFQHRRLARDADILVVDAAARFGNGECLPRGPLREPVHAARRASLLWVRETEERTAPLDLDLPIVRARQHVSAVVDPEGRARSVQGMRGIAMCGIARPSAFLKTLTDLGVQVEARHVVRDHAAFKPAGLARLAAHTHSEGLTIFTTEKDRVRLPAGFPAWVVRLGVDVLEGAELLDAALGHTSSP
jgi:tetraacyldisaccharide 4'-kinase